MKVRSDPTPVKYLAAANIDDVGTALVICRITLTLVYISLKDLHLPNQEGRAFITIYYIRSIPQRYPPCVYPS